MHPADSTSLYSAPWLTPSQVWPLRGCILLPPGSRSLCRNLEGLPVVEDNRAPEDTEAAGGLGLGDNTHASGGLPRQGGLISA